MVRFILGDAGCGKSTKIFSYILDDVKKGQKSILIVPDQESLFCERVIASEPFEPCAQLYTEVLSFSRLANKLFRAYGGLRYNYATRSDKNLAMYKAICFARNNGLKYYKKISKGREYTFVKLFLDAIGELKSYGVSASELRGKLDNLNGSIKDRLSDLLSVWGLYTDILKESGFDDAYDDIVDLANKLNDEKIDFINNYNIYIDSFYGFTKTQYDVIYQLIQRAKNVTFAFDCPENLSEGAVQYKKIVDTKNRILSYCSRHSIDTKFEACNTDYKHKDNEAIKYLADNVWNFEAEPLKNYKDINIVNASDEFEECEYVASRIKELILSGSCKYSNIAIVMRDAEKYRGLIDYALKKYEIPYFLSSAVDVMTLPAIKMIFCALRAISTYRPEDVIAYVKSSYLDINEGDLNEFESYIFKWNIYGKRFKDQDYWLANPDGYVQRMNKSQLDRRGIVHQVRDLVISKLEILEKAFKNGSVSECARAIFKFLNSHNIKENLEIEIKKSSKQEAYELSQIWNVLLRALDSLSSICADAIVSPEDFSVLLGYALSDTGINTIPPGNDVVVIGDARTIRAKDIEHTFILNVNEGVFPADVHDDGFFSDADKIALEGEDIELSYKSDTRAIDEQLNFCNAIRSASKSLTVSCLQTNISGDKLQPSNAYKRLLVLLGIDENNVINLKDFFNPIDKIYTREIALEYLSNSNEHLRSAIMSYFNVKEDEKEAKDGFTNMDKSVSAKVIKDFIGGDLALSKSRVESFASCKFKYYCSFVLGLRSSKRISFESADVGLLSHYVLEKFLELRDKKKINIATLNDAQLKKIVDEIVDEYIALICYSSNVSKRLRFLFNKLKKNLLVYLKNLINELVQSDFKDEYRELEMNGDSIKSPSALKFTLSNGSTISLNGVADRIDIYRKDDTAYIRVVDYKSGSDKTDIKNLSMGFGTQLFLYLLAICKLEKSEFRDKILMGAEKKLSGIKNIVPAGVMYFPMNMGKKNINYDIDFTNDNVNEKENIAIEEKIARSGYFLDEVDVILAQDKKQDGKILPKKDENPSSYIDRTKFDEIFDTIESTIKDIGNKILSGDASALPVANPNKSSKTSGSPCTYCEFKSICRNVKGVKD